jgi:hypothetical protein
MLDLYVRLFHVSLSVQAKETPSDLNRPLLQPFAWSSEQRVLGFRLNRLAKLYDAAPGETYREILRQLAPEFEKSTALNLAALLLKSLPGLAFRAELTLDAQTAAAPWEAVLAPHGWIFIRRVTRERRRASLPPWSPVIDVLTYGKAVTLRIRTEWRKKFFLRSFESSGALLETNPQVGVLRIIGVPIDNSLGLTLQVRLDRGEPFSVRGADLPLRYPALRLCIVQCPPAEVGRRLSSDRRNAAILKRIGAEIFSAGVPIVILLPVLPDRVAEALIDDIYAVVGKKHAVRQLQNVLGKIRRQPPDSIAPDSQTAEETLADICMYSIETVSLAMDLEPDDAAQTRSAQ